ncbi:tetratricopeptide repeat-containing serine protease family protein [Synechococcus sp. AH-601-C19]|nr:tetratricopeptide repeat-containing serine protease family protein [Synechococcus sp. AH-601-C19]
MPRRTTALAASALSLLPLGQPLLLGTLGITAATTAVVLHQGAAIAQDASAVARIAKAITVRIEGSTQGSGVIVKQEGNRYTVLTAWHVVSGNQPGEEVGIYTPDGKQHQLEQGSIQRLGQVDMAVITFSSPGAYEVASVGHVKSVSSGNPIFVSGFPLPTSSVPASIWRFLKGDVVANATVAIPDGYQLLYSNPTLPGMSGGSVLNSQGRLVGIHGRSERDDQVSMSSGKAVSTGTNQAVPISYYRQFNTGQTVVAANTQATSADDYLAQAKAVLNKRGQERKVIRLSSQALSIQPSARGYSYRGIAKIGLKDYQGAISDYNKAIEINPNYSDAYTNRGIARSRLADYLGAIDDSSQAIKIDPQHSVAYASRCNAKTKLKNYQGAISDCDIAIMIDPQYAEAFDARSTAKSGLGDQQGAIADAKKAIAIAPQFTQAYYNLGVTKIYLGDFQGAISHFNKSIETNPQHAPSFNNRGAAKGSLKDYQGAIDDFSNAIRIDPLFADPYLNRGKYNGLVGNFGASCKDFKKASSLGNQYAAQILNGAQIGALCRSFGH